MTDFSGALAAISGSVSDVHKAMELLNELGQPNLSETLPDLHNRLLVTRAAQSRVSEVVAFLIRLHRGIRNSLLDAQGELETASANVVQQPTFNHQNFASGEERKANLAFRTMEERRAVRQAEKALNSADAALEYGNNRFWELNRAVRDVEIRLQLITKEPNFA